METCRYQSQVLEIICDSDSEWSEINKYKVNFNPTHSDTDNAPATVYIVHHKVCNRNTLHILNCHLCVVQVDLCEWQW